LSLYVNIYMYMYCDRREGNNHVDKCAVFAKAYLNGNLTPTS
jgi:hypothetical protein